MTLTPAARDAQTVDRYLLALDGVLELSRPAFEALERDFIEHARAFARRAGINRDTWLDVGIPPRVLVAAYRPTSRCHRAPRHSAAPNPAP